jgi:proline iminopeptidase
VVVRNNLAPAALFVVLLFGSSAAVTGTAPACIASPTPSEHNEVLNGVRLYYRVAGLTTAGPPVIYLHGGPGYSSYSFAQTAGKRLETDLQMVYFDQRGSGCSERPWWSGAYSINLLVEDVEALRQKLHAEKISIIGHSFGGTIALEYASKYPEHVLKLVVVDAAIDVPSISELWLTQVEARYPKEWERAQGTQEAQVYAAAERTNDACTASKARFDLVSKALSSVNQQEFRDWEQFRDQRTAREQRTIDAQSGLSNTGELSRAMFQTASPSNMLCYVFSGYNRLTMPGARNSGQVRRRCWH